MTLQQKKLELIQGLLLLDDQQALFQIEKVLETVFSKSKKATKSLSFEEWNAQFEPNVAGENMTDYGFSTEAFRHAIWAAEKGPDMSLEEFFEKMEAR